MDHVFYIDIDEEISSIIDRLRKSLSVDNFFVIPKRAMVVQSIVNLKLLRREAEKLKKKAIIVSQDEQIIALAERADLPVRFSLEGLEVKNTIEDVNDFIEGEVEAGAEEIQEIKHKRSRLGSVGSENFYEENNSRSDNFLEEDEDLHETVLEVLGHKSSKKENLNLKKQSHVDKSSDGILRPKTVSGVSSNYAFHHERKQSPNLNDHMVSQRNEENHHTSLGLDKSHLDPEKEKSLERLYNKKAYQDESKPQMRVATPGKAKKAIVAFVFIGTLIFSGVLFYLFAPKAEVQISLHEKKKNVDASFIGGLNKQEDLGSSSFIPIEELIVNEDFSMEFQPTGVSDSSGQKAKGVLVIYNEFSRESQPLVASTRFETEDGRIYRITEGVTVPGVNTVDGKMKPGAIEVEVIADAPGEHYNIEPTSFSIPGFKGTSKYEKFYAKSSNPITGGLISADAVKSVTQVDIDLAKKMTEEKALEVVRSKLESQLSVGEKVFEDAIRTEIISSSPSSSIGDVRDAFEYAVKVQAVALVLDEESMKKALVSDFEEKTEVDKYIIEDMKLEYIGTKVDWENKNISTKVLGEVFWKDDFDSELFKKQLLGSDENQIRALMESYAGIEKLDVSIWPKFISHVPKNSKRVYLQIAD